jgi:putative hydroxymethylpyrimidine transport system substrate-binding protein
MVPSDPNDPLKLVAAGKIEFAVSYQPSVVMARSEGLEVVSIASLVQHPLSTILYLKESGIRSIQDLRGRKIGYSVGPLYKVLFEAAAENAGLGKSEYELFRVGFNLTPALLTRQADAVVGAFINYEAIQIELEGKEVGIARLEKNGIPDFYELVLITRSELIKNSPQLVRAFVDAFKKGVEKTLKNPDQVMGIFFKIHPDLKDELHQKSFTTTLPYFKGSPYQSEKRWKDLHDFMLERKLIDKSLPIEEMFQRGSKNLGGK